MRQTADPKTPTLFWISLTVNPLHRRYFFTTTDQHSLFTFSFPFCHHHGVFKMEILSKTIKSSSGSASPIMHSPTPTSASCLSPQQLPHTPPISCTIRSYDLYHALAFLLFCLYLVRIPHAQRLQFSKEVSG